MGLSSVIKTPRDTLSHKCIFEEKSYGQGEGDKSSTVHVDI